MFGKVRKQKGSKEIEKNETEIALTLYIEIPVSRWIEWCREQSRIKMAKMSYLATIETLSRVFHSKVTSMDQEAIKHTETSSMA